MIIQNKKYLLTIGILLILLIGLFIFNFIKGSSNNYPDNYSDIDSGMNLSEDELGYDNDYNYSNENEILLNELANSLESIKIDTTNWKTHRDDTAGFEFRYPETWQPDHEKVPGENADLYIRFRNPLRSGKPDTDQPSEMILIRRLNFSCEGEEILFSGKKAFDSGWSIGFGLIYHRDICLPSEKENPIFISLSAFDGLGIVEMNHTASSFRFF